MPNYENVPLLGHYEGKEIEIEIPRSAAEENGFNDYSHFSIVDDIQNNVSMLSKTHGDGFSPGSGNHRKSPPSSEREK